MSPYPSLAETERVPEALTTLKEEFPILVAVIPEGVPTAVNNPSLIASVSEFELVKL